MGAVYNSHGCSTIFSKALIMKKIVVSQLLSDSLISLTHFYDVTDVFNTHFHKLPESSSFNKDNNHKQNMKLNCEDSPQMLLSSLWSGRV